MMFVELPPPLPLDQRCHRAGWFPIHIPRLYFAVMIAGTHKSAFETWRFARRWFHAWVWGFAIMPWE